MHPIIYVDGELADGIGRNGMKALAQLASSLAGEPVDVLTHGATKYHAEQRIVGEPAPKTPGRFGNLVAVGSLDGELEA